MAHTRNVIGTLVLSVGALLGVIGWFTSFISQCVAESRDHLPVHHVWFTTWVDLALVIAICFLIAVGSVGFFKPLLVPFLIIAIVMSVLGADLGLYSDDGDMQGMGAGYLIFAIASVIWLLYLTFAESAESAIASGKAGAVFGGVPGIDGGISAMTNAATNASGNFVDGVSSLSNTATGAFGGLRNRFSLGKNKSSQGMQGMQNLSSGANNVGMDHSAHAANMGAPTGVVAHSPSVDPSAAQIRTVDNSVMPESVPSQVSNLSAAGMAPNAPGMAQNVPSGGLDSSAMASYPPQYAGDGSLAPPIVGNETAYSNTSQTAPTTGFAGVGSGVPPESATPRLQRAEALYSYKASEDDPTEISFNKGDILEIVDSSGKWWQAYRPNGELGIVPSNYLQML
ncbi:Transmembrane osmosensor [Malassezia brasiliensis]|uniref:Transmembrane osmosensor n=1 Tax=Malassezia brasiliensis TaxID=1821822 RepID=A0AAF0DQN2_9BASI|nr:Transmembrane osmosensor [Malassezia brasiliensis]